MPCPPGLSSPSFVGGQSTGEPAGAHLPSSAAQAASWPPQALPAVPAPPAASAAPVGAPGSQGFTRVFQGLSNPAAGVPLMPAPVLAGPQARLVPLLNPKTLNPRSAAAPPPRPLQATPPAPPGGSVSGAAAAADDDLTSLLAMLQQEPAEGSPPQPGPDPNPATAARAPAALVRQAVPCAAPALAPTRQAAGGGAPRGYSPPSSLAGPLAPAQAPAVQGGNQAVPWGRSCKQGSASAGLPPAAQPSHRGVPAHQCQKSESKSACAGNPPAAHVLTGVDLAAPLGLRTSRAGPSAGGGRQPMGGYPRPPPHLWPGGTSVAPAGLAPVGAPAAPRPAGDRPQQQPGGGKCVGHPQRLPVPGASSVPAGRSTPDPAPKFSIDLRDIRQSCGCGRRLPLGLF